MALTFKLFFGDGVPVAPPTGGSKHPNLPRAAPAKYFEAAAASVEKAITTTAKGGTQVVITAPNDTDDATKAQSFYFSRFSSPYLAAQTIPQQELTVTFWAGQTSGSGATHACPVIYIWRPNTQQVVGYIWDGRNNLGPTANKNVEWFASGNVVNEFDFFSLNATATTAFTGLTAANSLSSPVTCENGDVLVVEMWGNVYPYQDMSGACPRSIGINTVSSWINFTNALTWGTAAPTGAQTISVADPLTYPPMGMGAATDVAVLSSVASGLLFSPMLGADATSTVGRAPVLTSSVANAASYSYTPSTNTTATVLRITNSVPSPAATYAASVKSASDNIEIRAGPLNFAPMVMGDATSTIQIGVVNISSIASAASYSVSTTTPTTDVFQAYSVPTPAASYATAAANATSSVTRVYASIADAASFATQTGSFPATSSVNVTSAASLATFALLAASGEPYFSGVTTFYCIGDASNITITGGRYANVTYLPRGQHKDAANAGIDGVLHDWWGGTGNVVNRTISSFANTTPQSFYFGRFVSRPLAAQTIQAQNWNYAAIVGEGTTASKTFFAPVMYVWRPSTGTVVGHIFDGSYVGTNEWPATPATATRNMAGAAVTVQDGDMLVVEAWAVAQHTTAAANTQTWRITDKTSPIYSQYKVLYLPHSPLWFTSFIAGTAPSAGKNAPSNLPFAVTGSATTIANEYLWSEVAPNDVTPPQTALSVAAKNNLAAPQSYYIGRFSSLPLAAQTIPAQVWEYEVSIGAGSVNSHSYFWPVIYVYRPSTGTVVKQIFSDPAAQAGIEWRAPNDDPRLEQRFAGASANVLDNDILVVEIWGAGQQTTTGGLYLQRMWMNARNSRIVSPYKLQYYTGLKQTITSTADPATYDLAEADATSAYTLGRVDVPSEASPATYAQAATATTASSVQAFSVAQALTYPLMGLAAATSTIAGLSNAGAGSWALGGALGYGSIGRVSNGQPGAFSQGVSQASAGVATTAALASYAYSPTATTTVSIGRIIPSTANAAGYAYTPATVTADFVALISSTVAIGYSGNYAPTTNTIFVQPISQVSVALPATYTVDAKNTTESLGLVYTSVASSTSFSTNAASAYAYQDRVVSTLPAASYGWSGASASASLSRSSVALNATYSYSPQNTFEGQGFVYASDASSASFNLNAINAYAYQARVTNALPASYGWSGAATSLSRTSIALNVLYDFSPQSTTVALGRIIPSSADSTSFLLRLIDAYASLNLVTNAGSRSYGWSGASATSGQIRVVASDATGATYGYTAKDVTAGFTLITPSDAAKATYASNARDAYGYADRSSVASSLPFAGVSLPATTTTSFARLSMALPVEFIVSTPTTTSVINTRVISDASSFSFKTTGQVAVSGANTNSVAASTTYAATVTVGTTAVPSKNSIASGTSYYATTPDAWSGRVTFSVALSRTFSLSAPDTVSYIPGKQTSTALPATYSLSTTAQTAHRYGYVSQAGAARYLLECVPWPAFDFVPSIVKPPIVYPTYTPRAPISDAQFATWLEDERAVRVVLIETRCVEPITSNTELVYFASSGFVTKIEDGASVYYSPLMRGGLEFAQTIDLNLSGNQSYGDIELDNSTGDLDWMFDRIWLYKEFKAYVGDASWPRRDFRQIFDGNIEDVDSSQRDTVNVRLRDKFFRLDIPLHEDKVGGTTTNADRLLPFSVGECHNVTPVLTDPKQLYYAYHNHAAEGVFEVRDNGIPVDYIFMTGAPMSFKLSKQPYGRITCSLQGDKLGGGHPGTGYVNTVAPIIRRLMMEHGTEAVNRFTSADIDTDNFTAFDIANKYPVGLYTTERMTVLEACQTIASSIGARLTMTALGKAQLVKLQLPPSTESRTLVYNGDFTSGTDGWSYSGTNGGIVPDPAFPFATSINLNGAGVWNIPGQFVFFSHQASGPTNPAYYYEYASAPIIVEPGKQYTVSAYTGAHRCRVEVCFWEYTQNGTLLGSSPLAASASNDAQGQGGPYPTDYSLYTRVTDTAITRSNTYYIRVMLRKWDTKPGNVDSWMFVTGVKVESASTAAAAPIVVTESDMVLGSMHIADRLPLVPGGVLGYCKNWTVQEDTAQGVPEDHKSMYAREWLTIAIDEQLMRSKYGIPGQPEQENSLLLDRQSALTECGRRVNLRSSQRHVYEFVGFANLMFTPVGAPMTVFHRRFGLSAGKTGQVISVAVNWLSSQVTIKVLI
jgi:hypothetical protein